MRTCRSHMLRWMLTFTRICRFVIAFCVSPPISRAAIIRSYLAFSRSFYPFIYCMPFAFTIEKHLGASQTQPLIWNIYRVSAFNSSFILVHSLHFYPLFSLTLSSAVYLCRNISNRPANSNKFQLNDYFWMMLPMIIMTTIAIRSCLMRTMLLTHATLAKSHTYIVNRLNNGSTDFSFHFSVSYIEHSCV